MVLCVYVFLYVCGGNCVHMSECVYVFMYLYACKSYEGERERDREREGDKSLEGN